MIDVDDFMNACEAGAKILQGVTPIDAQRLVETTRCELISNTPTKTIVHIIQGGESRYGIRKEQDIEREVGYAKYVLINNNYVRANIQQIKKAIVDNL